MQTETMQTETAFRDRVLASLDSSLAAYNNGDRSFFNYFDKDATIFSVGSAEPIKGRDAYRKSFEAHLTGNKREETVLDRTVQIVGDKAVVAQTAQIKQSDVVANVRQTYVFGETGEGLKVLHLHNALIGTPFAGEVPTSPMAIRVLNEKIATAAAVLGVAQ
jgi:ketosteroid isomerase-like protein